VLFGRACVVCGEAGAEVCPGCLAGLRPAPVLLPPPGVDACHALLAYEGVGRELIARLKYRNRRAVLPGLAQAAAAAVLPGSVDLVTWPPTAAARRRQRGYDQAELAARSVARALCLPCVGLLRRRAGPAQTGRSAVERWAGPQFAPRRAAGGRILVVDDVVTTGGTVAAAAGVLRAAGAGSVVVLALSRTPAKGGHAE
jgi:predicted amidophosphoribosyltransferase